MPIPEDISKKLRCCISDPNHYFDEPIMLNCCAGNACKRCIQSISDASFKCCCGKLNKKDDYVKATKNEAAEMLKAVFIVPL